MDNANLEINSKLSNTLDDHVPLSPQWKLGLGKGNQFASGGTAELPKQSALIGDWDGKQSSVTSSFASPGQPRWKEDERDTTRRWGGAAPNDALHPIKSWADPNSANNPRGSVNPGMAPPAVDRWAPPASVGASDAAGRGRGIGGRSEDRWLARDRAQGPDWSLPGMGDAFVNPPIEAKPRWGEVNDPQKTPDGKPAVERWRAPGAAAAAAANSQAPGAIPAGESNAAAAGRGRGFAVGRGRGVMKTAPFSPGTDRWGEARGVSEGALHGGPVLRYTIQALTMIKQLVGKAPPPAGLISVATDYPEILADENGPDQKAPQAWSTQGRSESLGGEGGRPFVSQQAFAADQWVYKDPQGVTQGPFTRVEILDWHSAGFFPNELPVKAASDPDSHFLPLSTMVKMWERVDLGSAPPGFAPPLPAKSQPQTHPQPGLQLQTGFDSSSSITLGLMSPGQAQQSQRASTLLNPFDNVLANIPDSLDPHGQSFAPPPSVTGLWSSPLNPPQAPSSFQAQGHTLNAWLPSVPNAQGLSHQLHGPSAVQSQGMDQALFGQPPPSNTHKPWVTHPPSQDPVISNSWTPSIGQPGFTSFGQAPPTPALSAWGQPSGVHLMPNTQHEQQKEASHKPENFAPGPTVNASMPAPLQQLFAAAQRARQQQQEHQKALEQQQHQQRLQQEHQQQQHKHQVQQQQRQECLIFSSEQDRLLHSSSTDDAPLKPAEPKFAPWAAASAKAPVAKTLREIQEEEAARSAELMRQSQEPGSGPMPNSQGGAWSKIAASSSSTSLSPPPGAWGGSRPNPYPAPAPGPALGPSPPRGPTLGDILDRQLNPNPQPKAPAWGGAGVREAFHEESAADLEGGGGDDDESLAFAISQQQQALAAISMSGSANKPLRSLKDIQDEEERARQKSAGQESDPMLFWDYGATQDPSKAIGNRPVPPPPPPPARPPGMSAAAIAAKGAPPAPPKGGWATAAVVGKVMVPPPAPAPPPARPAAAAAVASASKSATPIVARSYEQASDPSPASDNVVLMIGDCALSSEFRDWCREQLRKLNGSDDLSLVEVILSMASRSEVADTCNMALGNKTGVGAFVAEFLKRKDAEVLRIQQAAKKKGAKKSGK